MDELRCDRCGQQMADVRVVADKGGLSSREAEYRLRDYLASYSDEGQVIRGFPKLCTQCISEIDWERIVGQEPELPNR